VSENRVRFTPGPWRTDYQKVWGSGLEIASIFQPGVQEEVGMCKANARLIAAAPDLLGVGQAALHLLETPGDFTETEMEYVREDLRIAIAKATGEGGRNR